MKHIVDYHTNDINYNNEYVVEPGKFKKSKGRLIQEILGKI